jgi:uncharacterized membrane protein YedE/YeeE
VTTDKRSYVVALLSGLLFAIGLGLAGMTNPHKVLNFLDLFGAWDPSLALVMGGAILVYAPVYRRLKGKASPKFGERFHWPSKQDVDAKLVIGSILFGIGWGIAGFCPGPAIVAVTGGGASVLAFFAAMVLGMLAHGFVARRLERRRHPSAAG